MGAIQSLIQHFRTPIGSSWELPCGICLPYKLKQLIDLVAQRNYLFTYDGKQYGLLKVERQ